MTGLRTLATAAVAAAVSVQAQSPAATVRIVEPTAATYLTGMVELSADVRSDVPVKEFTFFVDGVEACKFLSPPFVCRWEAGTRLTARNVRAVAVLTDGRRVTGTVRTKGIDVGSVVTVDAVMVPVHVTDNRGRFVAGLNRSQFRVLEDGKPQKITSFMAEDAAVSVLLTLDASGSMAKQVEELKTAALGFMQALRPQDAVTIAAFNDNLYLLAARTADDASRRKAIDQLAPAGATALYDAIIRSAEIARTQPGPRAIVLFTDGEDVASRATLDGARQALLAGDVVLYLLAQGKAADDPKLQKQLETLAFETGGAAFFSSRMSRLSEHFAEVVADISHQYVLVYEPERALGDGGWRTITVEIADKDRRMTIRARQGYLAVRRNGGQP